MTFITPLGDRVLVAPQERELKTASGMIIPDTAQSEAPQQGKVIALGNGGFTKDSVNPHDHLKVGDTVLFEKYVGDEVTINKKTLKLLRIGAIIGLVK